MVMDLSLFLPMRYGLKNVIVLRCQVIRNAARSQPLKAPELLVVGTRDSMFVKIETILQPITFAPVKGARSGKVKVPVVASHI